MPSARPLLALLALALVAVAFVAGGCPTTTIEDDPLVLRFDSKKYVQGFLACTVRAERGGEREDHALHEPNVTVHLPGLEVELRDAATDEVLERTVTDLSGRFRFPAQESGRYEVCWDRDGFVPARHAFTIASRPIRLGTLPVRVQKGRIPVYGVVKRHDKTSIRTFDPMAGVNVFPVVEQRSPFGKAIYRTAVNNHGRYLIPAQRFLLGGFRLRARLEEHTEVRTIAAEQLATSATHELDVTLMNFAPELGTLTSTVGGVSTRVAAPGDVVDLRATATDAEGDPVTLRWTLGSGHGELSAPTGSAVQWRLPDTNGSYTVRLLASDGQGGFDRDERTIFVGREGTPFSGRVSDVDASPLAAVDVEVVDALGNARTTATNAAGYFSLAVEPSSRYVLNLRKEGYMLVSRIYLDAQVGGRWQMREATTVLVDPRQPIVVEDDASDRQRPCHLPYSARVDWQVFGTRRLPRVQDGRGHVVEVGDKPVSLIPDGALRDRREGRCGPGMRVSIPADSIVDANGDALAPGTQVRVTVGTVDLLDPDSMPGDWSAVDGRGDVALMDSFGAGSVELDVGGQEVFLREGARAEIAIPVSDLQLAAGASPPATIPKLFYDEVRGLWIEDGALTLDPAGSRYVGTTEHFTTFNADILKSGQSCVRLTTDGIPVPYRVEVVIPRPNLAPRVLDQAITDASAYYAIINLPNDTDITITAYEPVDDPSGFGRPYGVYTVNTNGEQTGDPTAPDYFECETKVKLYPVETPEPGPDAFLHGLAFEAIKLAELDEFGVVVAPDPDLRAEFQGAAAEYYSVIDPMGRRRNLTEFLRANGFDADGDPPVHDAYADYGEEDEVRASYANALDLGFGRDMHGKRTTADDGELDVAFYVSNYGSYDSDDAFDFKAAAEQDKDNGDGHHLFATVCMEYSRIEDPPADPYLYTTDNSTPEPEVDPNDPATPKSYSSDERVVKYFVYGADGQPVYDADLDGRGLRPIPQLCVVCHGGAYTVATPSGSAPSFPDPESADFGSLMLPFDVEAYVIEDGLVSGFDEADQWAEFRHLNEMVRDTEPGEAIEEIVDAMHPASDPPDGEPRKGFVVDGWSADPAHVDAYTTFIAQSCRTCHASRHEADVTAGIPYDLRFNDVGPWLISGDGEVTPPAELRVCGLPSGFLDQVMPHALATFDRFWGSYDPAHPALFPYQPARFKAFLDGVVEPATPFTGLGDQCVTALEPDDENTAPPGPTFTEIYDEVLSENGCTVCHDSDGISGIVMDLSTRDNAHDALVGVDAQTLTSGKRVVASDPGASFLLNKVRADFPSSLACVGGDCGGGMPNDDGIDDGLADLVEQWIDEGAKDD